LITKYIPPSRPFFFECSLKCGEYPVAEKTLREFITGDLAGELDERFKEGAVGAKLTFENGCPRCEPNSPHEVELSALRKKLH